MQAMRNREAPHIDYGFLTGVVPTKYGGFIAPSNVDGILERHGKFLVLEWKRDNEDLSMGQTILLTALARQPNFTVILVYGHSAGGDTEIREFYKLNQDGSMTLSGKSVEEFKKKYKAWFDLASKSEPKK